MGLFYGVSTFSCRCFLDVDVERGGVGEVPQSGFVRHHGLRRAVLLPVSGLGEVDLLKLEGVVRLKGHGVQAIRPRNTYVLTKFY